MISYSDGFFKAFQSVSHIRFIDDRQGWCSVQDIMNELLKYKVEVESLRAELTKLQGEKFERDSTGCAVCTCDR